MFDITLWIVAGFLGGMLNAVAGGGTFITFPALIFTGVPPIAANATTTVAALPGYLAATWGFRKDLSLIDNSVLRRLTMWTMFGGAIGSGLLLVASNQAFAAMVPFLLLAATVVFLYGPKIRRLAAHYRAAVTPFGLGTLLPMAVYGGFFNGGLGIIMLALFALWGMVDLHQMNGLKSWLSTALSVMSLAIFATGGQVYWTEALWMSLGTIAGGSLGAPVARRLPAPVLRGLIASVGFGMTVVFFWRLVQ